LDMLRISLNIWSSIEVLTISFPHVTCGIIRNGIRILLRSGLRRLVNSSNYGAVVNCTLDLAVSALFARSLLSFWEVFQLRIPVHRYCFSALVVFAVNLLRLHFTRKNKVNQRRFKGVFRVPTIRWFRFKRATAVRASEDKLRFSHTTPSPYL
jgi:hypothetical protein